VRRLARAAAVAWLARREELGFPLLRGAAVPAAPPAPPVEVKA
jgi:hypothetical protein